MGRQDGNSGKLLASSCDRLDPLAPLGAELVKELNERVDILMAENALLVEQKFMLNQELEGYQKELAGRTDELQEAAEKLGLLEAELKSAEKRASLAEKDREEAGAQAIQFSDALGRAESVTDSLTEQCRLWQGRCKELEAAVKSSQQELSQNVLKTEAEGLEYVRKMKRAEDRTRELHVLLLHKAQELDGCQEVLRKLRREYQSTRQDAEGMLQVMGGLERQLSEYAAREAEVQQQGREAKERVEEALAGREQAVARAEQSRREIERLLEERRLAALRKQADVEAAVESSRQRGAEQLRAAERDMQDLVARNAQLLVEAERAQRDCKSARELLERSLRSQAEERRTVETCVKEMAEKLNLLAVSKEEESGRKAEVQEQNKEFRASIDKLRTQGDLLRTAMAQQERSSDAEIAQLKTLLRELQREQGEKTRVIAKMQKEFDDSRDGSSQQSSAAEKRLADENGLYRRRSQEAEKALRDSELEIAAERQRWELQAEQLREKCAAAGRQAEGRAREATEAMRVMAVRCQEAEGRVREAAAERLSLQTSLRESRSATAELQNELEHTKAYVVELHQQLSESYLAREEGVVKSVRALQTSSLSHRPLDSLLLSEDEEEEEEGEAEDVSFGGSGSGGNSDSDAAAGAEDEAEDDGSEEEP